MTGPEHPVTTDMQSLTMAAGSIHARSLTPEGREQLIECSGEIASVALAMLLTAERIKKHVNESRD